MATPSCSPRRRRRGNRDRGRPTRQRLPTTIGAGPGRRRAGALRVVRCLDSPAVFRSIRRQGPLRDRRPAHNAGVVTWCRRRRYRQSLIVTSGVTRGFARDWAPRVGRRDGLGQGRRDLGSCPCFLNTLAQHRRLFRDASVAQSRPTWRRRRRELVKILDRRVLPRRLAAAPHLALDKPSRHRGLSVLCLVISRLWRCALPTVVWGNSDERGARRPLTPSRRSLRTPHRV